MRKLFALFVAAIVAMAFASYVYAGSADARNVSIGKGVSQVNALSDISTGNTAEIDSSGNVYVRSGSATVVSSTGSTLNTGTQLITGVANIQSIVVGGPTTTAGDYVLLYDNTSTTGTPKWDIAIGTAKNTIPVDCFGAGVTNGIFADSNSDTVFVSVVYN